MGRYTQEGERLRLAAAGESLLTRPLSGYGEKEFRDLIELIRGADAAFTHLEVLLGAPGALPPGSLTGGIPLLARPRIADELVWAGFNLFSVANNHSMDYGVEGILSTIDALDARGLVHTGLGRHLAEARKPKYLDTARGRIGLMSIASGPPAATEAGEQRPDGPGRPGLNALRYESRYVADGPTLKLLREVSEKIGWEEKKRGFRRLGRELEGPPVALDFLRLKFVEGETPGLRMVPHPRDLEENLRWVSDARRQADWVVVSFHHHHAPPNTPVPSELARSFARQCIDAGADAFFGHGPHVMQGVEIYQDRPIFYSLGNFAFQIDTLEWIPADIYGLYGLGPEATLADVHDRRWNLDEEGKPRGGFRDADHWESVLAVCEFEGRRLAGLSFQPLTLGGAEEPRPRRGRPLLADPGPGERIIARLAELSEPFGTRIEWDGSRGLARLG